MNAFPLLGAFALMNCTSQVRLSLVIPLRVCLIYGYACLYARLQASWPWTMAILVSMSPPAK